MSPAEFKQKLFRIVPHLLVWGILFSFPLIFSYGENPQLSKIYIKNWLPLFFSAIIFYINYLYLIDRFLHQSKTGTFILVNLLLIPLLIYSMELFKDYMLDNVEWQKARHHHKNKPWVWLYFKSAFSLILTVGFSLGVSMTEKWRKYEREKKILENERLKSELTHLKYQLQPHFFFNSLNSIYSLIDNAPDKAKDTVHGLGKLMRYLLYDSETQMISLDKEIHFIKKFLELMSIRLSDKVKITSVFPSANQQIEIPPLLLIPLVENAFKHGVSSESPSFISIELYIHENILTFKVANSYFPKAAQDKSISGIGIENLTKRLSRLYPGKFELKQELKNNQYLSELKITL